MKFNSYKLGDCITFKNGKKRNNKLGKYPVYGGNGVLGYTDNYNSESNSIIIGRVGAYCGCVYKEDNKCWVSDNAIVGKVKENFDYNYMYYLLSYLNLNKLHIGSSHPLMTQDILNNIQITIPDKYIQSKISKILERLDKKIELNNKLNNNLYEVGIELLKNDFISENRMETLLQVIKFVKGKKPNDIITNKRVGYEKYLTIACLNGQELNYADTTKMIMSDNDLLMVMDGASSGEVYYGGKGIVGSTLSRIDCIDNNYISEFIFFVLKYYKDLIQSKNTGSAIPHTDKVFVGSLEIPKLNIGIQEKYKVILSKIKHNQNENKTLEQLRDTLLPKLMNGEIDLDNIEI